MKKVNLFPRKNKYNDRHDQRLENLFIEEAKSNIRSYVQRRRDHYFIVCELLYFLLSIFIIGYAVCWLSIDQTKYYQFMKYFRYIGSTISFSFILSCIVYWYRYTMIKKSETDLDEEIDNLKTKYFEDYNKYIQGEKIE